MYGKLTMKLERGRKLLEYLSNDLGADARRSLMLRDEARTWRHMQVPSELALLQPSVGFTAGCSDDPLFCRGACGGAMTERPAKLSEFRSD